MKALILLLCFAAGSLPAQKTNDFNIRRPLLCGGNITEKERQEMQRRRLEMLITQYSWTRKWIEEHCATSSVPASQRVFIIRESRPRAAFIIAYMNGMTLRDLVALTPFRDSASAVEVFRQVGPIEGRRIDFDSAEMPTFKIQPMDLVRIYGRPK
jgi:hypothetical protein